MDRTSKEHASKADKLMPCGIYTDSVASNQQGYFLSQEINRFIEQYKQNIIVFFNQHDRIPVMPLFGMLQSVHLWSFSGLVISTSVENLTTAKNIPTIKKHLLYLYDLEWLFHIREYEYYANAYLDDGVDLIVRSPHHYSMVEQYWKKPKYILENFDKEGLYEILSQESRELRFS